MLWIILTVIITIAALIIGIATRAVRSDEIEKVQTRNEQAERYNRPAEIEDLPRELPVWGGFLAIFLPLMLVNTVISSIAYTAPCYRKVQFFMNMPMPGYVSNGLQLMAPWYDTESFNTCRDTLVMKGEDTLAGVARGGVNLPTMDAAIPYRILPDHMWRVRLKVGNETKLIDLLENTVRSAARATQANFEWRDIVYNNRGGVEDFFAREVQQRVTVDLVGAGLEPDEAAAVFVIPEARIRDVRPSQAVLDEQANFEKAQVQLTVAQTQKLTAAEQGTAIRARFQAMAGGSPEKPVAITMTAAEQASILHALADLTRAEAVARIASDEKRDIPMMVLPSNSSVALPIPAAPAAK